jgi:serralysin
MTRLATLPLLLAALLACPVAAAPGEPDLRFGDGGVVFIDTGGDEADRIEALVADADGSVWATGSMNLGINTGADLAVVRLLPDGTPDPMFGDDGIAGFDAGGGSDIGRAILRQPDGRLLVAGRLNNGAHTDWGLARFNANGSLDTSFGEIVSGNTRRGYVRVDVAPDAFTNDQAVDLALQSDGRIVVAGHGYQFQCGDGTNNCGFKYERFALVRFTTDGVLDPGFGDNGRVISSSPLFQRSELATAIAKRADGSLPPDDSITVVGYAQFAGEAQVRRYLANGSPDLSFAGNGLLRIADSEFTGRFEGIGHIAAGVLQDDGRLVVAGTGMDRAFALLRINANGSIDTSFGGSGNGLRFVKFSVDVEYDEAYALVLHADGRLTAAGFATAANNGVDSEDFAVAQLLPDGTPDPAFGDGQGRVRYPLSLRRDIAHAIAAMPGDGVLAAGFALDEDAPANSRAAFLRLVGSDRIFRNGFE